MVLKIVLTGDNHLNYYNQRMGSRLRERRSWIGRAWRQTVDYAIKNEVDLYLHLGDLFDQISPRNPPRARVVEAFRELHETGIETFVLAGNHEAPASMRDGASPHSVIDEAGFATVFENALSFEQNIIEIQGKSVSIAGMSFNRRLGPGEDPLENLTIPAGADLNIAMLHYSIERIAPPLWEEPQVSVSSLENNSQIDLFAMGHIHAHGSTKVGNSLVLYPGATERYDFGESGHETGFFYVTFDDGIEFEFIPTEAQPMSQLKLHTSRLSPENPTQDILKAVEEGSSGDGLCQLVLEGEVPFDEYIKINFTKIFDEGWERNFYFEYIDRIKPIIEGLKFIETEGLHPRKELSAMGQQAVESANPEERELWKRAAQLALSYYDKHWEG
jgi:DNA repair exonuclease SbcCD nuclease subunit